MFAGKKYQGRGAGDGPSPPSGLYCAFCSGLSLHTRVGTETVCKGA